jgi:hypothetical protein
MVELVLSVVYILFFLLLIQKLKFFDVPGITKTSISIVFGLKIIAGIVLWAIYTFYYKDRSTADIFKYFDDSKILFDSIRTHPSDFMHMLFGMGNNSTYYDQYYVQMHNWARQYDSNLYNDSHTIIRFNAFARLFSFGYYQIHSIFLCFLSLSGLVAIYKVFAPLLPGKEILAAVSIFLFPSVLFWGSGVLKEGIIFFGLGILLLHWFNLFRFGFRISSILYVGAALLLLLATKFYILVSIIPGLVFIAWVLKRGANQVFLKFSIVMVCYGSLGLAVRYFIPAYDPLQVLVIKQQDFVSLARGGLFLRNDTSIVFLTTEQRGLVFTDPINSKTVSLKAGTSFCYWHDYNSDADTLFGVQGPVPIQFTIENDLPRSGSLIHIPVLKATLSSFLMNLPIAWFNTLFRPFPSEARSLLLLIPALEIGLYIACLVACLMYRNKNGIAWEYVLFCLSFVALLYGITGLTTPVLGALVRYKVPGIPFLMLSLLFLFDERALYSRFPILEKAGAFNFFTFDTRLNIRKQASGEKPMN